MGDATVPHPPSRHKGAKLRFEHRSTKRFPAALRLPTGVLPRKRLAYSAPGGASPLSPLETTPKDREWQRKKKQMVFSLQPDKRHTRRCEDAVIQGTSVSTAGRRLLDFVGSAYRPLLRMGELTACGQLIPNIFSFPPYTAHFLFDVSKRKWGVYSDRQSLHPCGGSLHPDRDVPLLEAKKILGTFLTAKP